MQTPMNSRDRTLIALAALLALGAFALPLWRIELIAPQYPEGLGMLIRLDTITGIKPNDLNSINGLNHYIGMRAIDPAAIPVLDVMPWVVGALAAAGLLVAAIGSRALLWAWLVTFALAGAAGLAEFWRWGYDYGHNLAPDAAIKVPGMSYQPPLLGTKQLLNFTAASWPSWGGILLGVAFAVGLGVAVAPLIARRRRAAAAVALAATAATAACRGVPRAIAYGEDGCDYCRMEITDPRYGAEVVMKTGKAHTFDSIECMAGFVATLRDSSEIESLWVSDYQRPGRLLALREARLLRATQPGSPMGGGIVAIAIDADSADLAARLGAHTVAWQDVRRLALAAPGEAVAAVPASSDAPAAPGAGVVARAATTGSIVVDPAGPVRTIAEGIRLAAPGGRVVVRAGVYREPTIVVDRPLEIVGEGLPTLDGEGTREIMQVVADDVTVRGLRFAHVGTSFVEDRAALRIRDAKRCAVTDNRIDSAFFAIYLANVTGCRIERNVIRGADSTEATAGNGIHLWSTRSVTIAGNTVTGHRDGIYFEFVHDARVERNTSEGNLRYGLHFMYSDDCEYADNTFRRNGSGVAVMYTKRVTMRGNHFADNWGSAAYGLLVKEVADARLERNTFARNTVAFFADGADRMTLTHNVFTDNGWALRLAGSTNEGEVTANNFSGNSFDVVTTTRSPSTRVSGNWWQEYRGYDLDRDGVGDVPHRPVRLFSVVVEHNPPAMMLLRSGFVGVLDTIERAIPSLTPETLVDASPAMTPVR
ncbi:MAG TPA: nitrous oxide reductase family maturation protein NosD [Gemmatimonadaceae bacterium]|nr:nitrous oxide reductase family maturation protein NosD [Gemmatimonadaceae bacterium]